MVVYAAAVALLVVTGSAKLLRPRSTATALAELVGGRATRLRGLARLIGATELAAALAAVVLGGRATALCVCALYTGFCAVVVAQLRTGTSGSCGCAGGDSPATVAHLVLTAGAALAAATSTHVTRDGLLLALAGVLAWLSLATMTTLADLAGQLRA